MMMSDSSACPQSSVCPAFFVVQVSTVRSDTLAMTGIGLFFSAFMLCLTAIQARYTGFSPKSSEEFNSASRSVKPGLIASGIVSAWTWAATLVSTGIERVRARLSMHMHVELGTAGRGSCNLVRWHTRTGYRGRGGMVLVRQCRCCS